MIYLNKKIYYKFTFISNIAEGLRESSIVSIIKLVSFSIENKRHFQFWTISWTDNKSLLKLKHFS